MNRTAQQDALGTGADAISIVSPSARRRQVLIVDDDPIVVQSLNKILGGDYDVRFALSGPDALTMIAAGVPDLLLLDVDMPEMSGIDVCRQLRADAHHNEMTVLFVTAQTSPDIEVTALNAGGSDFIHKPLVPELVRARIRLHAQLQEQREVLRTLAFADGLTGLWNRRKFDETLATEWRWSRRQSGALSVLMLDVDHFKQYNDRYGHLDGDRCLKSVAGAIRHCAGRPHDLVARYGGEEFAFILPDASLSAALAIAEKARMAVAGLEMPHDVSPVASHVTVSIGVASMLPSDDIASDMLRRADQALYAAKQRGRNQVCANGP